MGLSALFNKVIFLCAFGVFGSEIAHAGEDLRGLFHRGLKNCLASTIPNRDFQSSENAPANEPSPSYPYYKDLQIELLARLVGGSQEMTGDQRTLAANLILGRKLNTHSQFNYPAEVDFTLRVEKMMKQQVESDPARFGIFGGKDNSLLILEILRLREVYGDRPIHWGVYAMDHAKTRDEITVAQEILNQADNMLAYQMGLEIQGVAAVHPPGATEARIKQIEQELIAQAKAPEKRLDQIGLTPAQKEEFQLRQALSPILRVGYFRPGVFAQALSQALMDLGATTDRKIDIALWNIRRFKKVPGIEIPALAAQTLKRLNEIMRLPENRNLVPDWEAKYGSDLKVLAFITQEIESPSPQLIRKATNFAAAYGRLFGAIVPKLSKVVCDDGKVVGTTMDNLMQKQFDQVTPFEREVFLRQALGVISKGSLLSLIRSPAFTELNPEFQQKYKQELENWKEAQFLFFPVGASSIAVGAKLSIENFLDVVLNEGRWIPIEDGKSWNQSPKFAEYLKAEYETALKDPVRGPVVVKKIQALAEKVAKGSVDENGVYRIPKYYDKTSKIAQTVLKVFTVLAPRDPSVVSGLLDIFNFYYLDLNILASKILAEKYFDDPKVRVDFFERLNLLLKSIRDEGVEDANFPLRFEKFSVCLNALLAHKGGAEILNKSSERYFVDKIQELLKWIGPYLIKAKTLPFEAKQWILTLAQKWDSLNVLTDIIEKSAAFTKDEKIASLLGVLEALARPDTDVTGRPVFDAEIVASVKALLRVIGEDVSGLLGEKSPYLERVLKILKSDLIKNNSELMRAVTDFEIKLLSEGHWDPDLFCFVGVQKVGETYVFEKLLRKVVISGSDSQANWDVRIKQVSLEINRLTGNFGLNQLEGPVGEQWLWLAIMFSEEKTPIQKAIYRAILNAVGTEEHFEDRLKKMQDVDKKIAGKIKRDLKKLNSTSNDRSD